MTGIKHIFMDTNVVIDFLANRQPFSLDAARLFNITLSKKAIIYISAVSYNNIYYILRRSVSSDSAIKLLIELADMTEIIDVTRLVVRQALKSGFKDYEDAIQYYCALSSGNIDFIVTMDTKDFKKSTLSVMTPSEAVSSLGIA